MSEKRRGKMLADWRQDLGTCSGPEHCNELLGQLRNRPFNLQRLVEEQTDFPGYESTEMKRFAALTSATLSGTHP
jgi:hypothetical protein